MPETLPTACPHRWRIATPNGPTVQGVCRLCGAERTFPTVTDDNVWETGPAIRRARREADAQLAQDEAQGQGDNR